jgi:hypothetical protein
MCAFDRREKVDEAHAAMLEDRASRAARSAARIIGLAAGAYDALEMSMVDPNRYRAALVLLASLSDDGLEDLALRLVRPDYPDAYRTGPGRDDGVDVFSDLNAPPERAWQAKNCGDKIDWAECRKSLKSAMALPSPPPHYTFVFPRKLKKGELTFWREKFVTEQKALYPQLKTLDQWDDLAERLEVRPDLIDLLNDGALASYLSPTIERLAQTGASPLASGTELLNENTRLAGPTAAEIGRHDPYFRYTRSESEAGEQDVPHDRRLAFTMRADQQDSLPRYEMKVREGESVRELTAEPRAGAVIAQPKPWFADDEAGNMARMRARVTLAKGQSIVLDGEAVGLQPGSVPDRFRSLPDPNGLLRNGRLELGLSEPLVLTVTMVFAGEEVIQPLLLYRVPELPGDALSYAGAYHGTVLALNLAGERHSNQEDIHFDAVIDVTLFMESESAADAVRGLGFARAFGQADQVLLECPGLLPESGLGSEDRTPPQPAAEEVWHVASIVAGALAELEKRDGRVRMSPGTIDHREVVLAETVLQLLHDDELHIPCAGTFDAPLPADTDPQADPGSLLRFTAPLPHLCGFPTLTVEQRVEGATAIEVVQADGRAPRLRCQAREGQALMVTRRVDGEVDEHDGG